MYSIYVLTPLCAWIVSGLLKFIIHSIRNKRAAFHMIGYGGMPSTHTAIVSSTTTIIAFKEGIETSSFSIALTLSIIVLIDANGLRKHIGRHAHVLNILSGTQQLRERIGHSILEIAGGLILGCLIGYLAALM